MFRSKRRELQENLTKTNIDIIVSLIPMLLVAFFVYEITPVLVILSAVAASELIEIIFSFLVQKNRDTIYTASCSGICWRDGNIIWKSCI